MEDKKKLESQELQGVTGGQLYDITRDRSGDEDTGLTHLKQLKITGLMCGGKIMHATNCETPFYYCNLCLEPHINLEDFEAEDRGPQIVIH